MKLLLLVLLQADQDKWCQRPTPEGHFPLGQHKKGRWTLCQRKADKVHMEGFFFVVVV